MKASRRALSIVLITAVSALGLPAWSSSEDPASSHVAVDTKESRLVVQRLAPVPYKSAEEVAIAIEGSLPASAAAIRLTRTMARETVDYVFGVTEHGRLVVGRQFRRYDAEQRSYVFEKGEVWRAFSPLDRPGAWTWLVPIEASRGMPVTMELRAQDERWPVKRVAITLLRAP